MGMLYLATIGLYLCALSLNSNALVVSDASRWTVCPGDCDCIKGDGGRLEVQCLRGGLNDRSLNALLKDIPSTTNKLVIDGARRRNQFQITTAFKRFAALEELHLTHCGLTSLGERTFARLKSLRLLNLAHNRLSYVTPETFDSTEHLQALVLDHNRLGDQLLPTGAFSNLRRLRSLSLAHNQLSHFPNSFLRGIRSLETLVLDGNRPTVDRLVNVLRDVPNLKHLSLNGCRLGQLPADTFAAVGVIERLQLADNELGLIPIKTLSKLKHLTQLDLSGNNLVYVQPYAFAWAPHLQSIFLARNKLGATYTVGNTSSRYGLQALSFANLTVSKLDLSYNQYTEFDSSALGSARDTVRILHLSGNQLRRISPYHTNGLPLTELHISDTGLHQLPFSLPPEYAYIQMLNVSHNRIGHISEQAANQLSQHLVSLDISHCDFRLFPSYALYQLAPRLRVLRLDGNPWDCHCQIVPLKNFMTHMLHAAASSGGVEANRRRLAYDRVVCDQPPEFRNVPLLSVVRPPDCALWLGAVTSGLTKSSELGILVGVVLVAGTLAVLLVLFICYKTNWKYSGAYETRESSRMSGASSGNTHLCPSTNGTAPLTPSKEDHMYEMTI